MCAPVALVTEKSLCSPAIRLIGALAPGWRLIAIGDDVQKLSQSLTTTVCCLSLTIDTWKTFMPFASRHPAKRSASNPRAVATRSRRSG